MTDLEMTKLCAEAMGEPCVTWFREVGLSELGKVVPQLMPVYDPLHDDAQAMALGKSFTTQCLIAVEMYESHGGDLNRAIVEYVAKMQKRK